MKQRLIGLIAAAGVLASALTGCGTTSTPGNSTTGSEGERTEPITVTAVLQLNPEIVLDDNPIIQLIEEELNIRLEVEAPPQTSYGDRVKMLVSTGDMPDLVCYGADAFARQWAEEGLLLDVTDRIGDYANLSRNISQEQFGDVAFLEDGRYYGVPRPNSYDKWGFLINTKWLEEVDMEAPTTVDEFVEVCRAFTTMDPDGNGQDDTYGASFGASQSSLDSGIWSLNNDFLSMAYSISSWHYGMPDVDGSAKLRTLKSLYPDYMELMRSLYEEGIIDREFITHDNANEPYEKLAQKRVGIVGASETNYTTNVLEKYSLDPDEFMYCPPLVLNEGDTPVYAMPPSNWMAYYINANSSPEVQDAVLRLLDWANSEEGFVAMQFGIAGTDYNSYDAETHTIDRTEEQIQNVQKVTSNMFAFANALDGRSALEGGSSPEMIEKWQKESSAADAVTEKCYFGFTKMLDRIGSECPDEASGLNNLEVRYVTGEVSFGELEKYITETYAPATAEIAQEFAEYMQQQPARYEK